MSEVTEDIDVEQLVLAQTPTIRMSMPFGELARALAAAQLKMPVPKKSKTNSAFNSKYADVADVLVATRILNEHEIAVMGTTVDEGEFLKLVKVFAHPSNQWQEGTLTLPVGKLTPQAFGSACTFASRYLMQIMCNMAAEEDDDDGAAATRQAEKDAEKSPLVHRKAASPTEINKLRIDARRQGASDDDVAAWVRTATDGRTSAVNQIHDDEMAKVRAEATAWRAERDKAQAAKGTTQPTLEGSDAGR